MHSAGLAVGNKLVSTTWLTAYETLEKNVPSPSEGERARERGSWNSVRSTPQLKTHHLKLKTDFNLVEDMK